MVGGSSNTWGGLTTHFIESELFRKTSERDFHWPIKYSELMHFYNLSSDRYGFQNTLNESIDENIISNDLQARKFYANNPPLNFKNFIDTLEIDLIINAYITSLNQKGKYIESILCKSLNSKNFLTIKADTFILACGTLETIKLLLNQLDRKKLSIGIESRNIGRYFMNHPKFINGVAYINKAHKKFDLFCPKELKARKSYWGLSLSEVYQHKNKLLNSYIHFASAKKVFPLFKNLFKSNLKKIIKYLCNFFNISILKNVNIEPNIKIYPKNKPTIQQKKTLNRHLKKIKNFINNIYIYFYLNKYDIYNFLEMEPAFSNRIYLSKDFDPFGNKYLCISYKLSKKDINTINNLYENLAHFLKREKLGFLKINKLKSIQNKYLTDSSHHLGGLIMGDTPENSVVDNNLKVHSLENLYLISGGVFPTSGSGNPTWTLAALSIRLAEKITLKLINEN